MSYQTLNNTPTSFPRFPDLPAEIQLQICEFAVPEPRSISYSTQLWDDRTSSNGLPFETIYKRTFTVPGIISACIDSRIEALKRYQPAFTIELGRPIYIDFDRDIFEFGDFQALQAFSWKNSPFSGSKMEGDKVLTLSITLDEAFRETTFILICSNFAGLKTLLVRDLSLRNTADVPLSRYEGSEITKAWRFIGDIVRRYIGGRGGDSRAWKPPTVIRGSKAQWNEKLREGDEGLASEMQVWNDQQGKE